jgi:hypothetical protein
MKRTVFPIVLFAMLKLPLFAASPVQYIGLNVPVENHSNMPHMRAMAMDKPDFKLLYSLLKEESFDKERVKMIRVACIGNYFTSKQCASMLSLMSFDSYRLEALEYLAPRILDKRACDVILREFSFSSNKEKAETLLMGDRRR